MGLFDNFRSLFRNNSIEPSVRNNCLPEQKHESSAQATKTNMPTLSSVKIIQPRKPFPPTGNTEAICPYCNSGLDKFPGRKKRCPACGKDIYVRTRPSDRVKILVTEDQVQVIEAQYSAVSGIDIRGIEYRFANEDANLFKRTKQEIASQLGKEPEDWQVYLSILATDYPLHAKNNDWGLFRNARLDMAMLYHKANLMDKALPIYCEVCFVDLNGPRNLGDPGRLRESFDKSMAMIPTGVYEMILQAMHYTEIDMQGITNIFLRVAATLQSTYGMSVPPETALKKFQSQLRKQDTDA